MKWALVIWLTAAAVFGCTSLCASDRAAKDLSDLAGGTELLAAYMPWFGDQGHISVGYSSQDVRILGRQIDDARSRGISGFVVHWTGPRRPFTDRAFALLERVASEKRFKVALLYNESDDESPPATQDALRSLDEAYDKYIGPRAEYRDAYLTVDGHPLIFIFPKKNHADWNRIRSEVSRWSTPPLLLYKDEPPPQFSDAFDGFFPWVHPGHGGWAPDGSDWGKQYLENFFDTMSRKYRSKIVLGAAWPGFDDSRASWGLNRKMNPRCGETLRDTLSISSHQAKRFSPMPFLLIATWNDYEEGSAIERESANCGVR